MCSPEDPLFTPLLYFARVPFQAKELKHKTLLQEKLGILASTASTFAQILAHKPPNLKLSVHKTLLSEAKISLQAPHSEIRAAHPYLKKSWVPPSRRKGRGARVKVGAPGATLDLGFGVKALQLKYESFEHKLVYMFYGFPPSFFSLVSEPYNNNGSL